MPPVLKSVVLLSGANLQILSYTLVAIVLLFSAGFWLSSLLQREKPLTEICAAAPVLGLMIFVLVTANLNYLGVPVKISAPLLVALFSAASVYTAWRIRGRTPKDTRDFGWWSLSIALAAALAFLMPYFVTGGYYAYNDAVYYVSIADFVRDHSYFASTAAGVQYPWLRQMGLAQLVWARMGAQYVLAAVSALTGVDGAGVFIPVLAAGIAAACCGFWMLLRRLTASAVAALLGVVLYAGNVTFVHYVAGLNFASQTLALGGMYLLIALAIEGLDSLRSRFKAALILAGMASIYPEMFPAAGVPVLIAIVYDWFTRRTRIAIGILHWAEAVGLGLVLNAYTWVHLLPNIVTQYNSTDAGFVFLQPSWLPVDLYFGLAGPEKMFPPVWNPVSRFVGTILLAVAVFGIARAERKTRWLIVSAAAIYAAMALVQLQLRHFPYAALKVLVYSFYLAPVALALGLAVLLAHGTRPVRAAGRVLCGVWLIFACGSFSQLVATSYFSASYPLSLWAGKRWRSLEELRSLMKIPAPGDYTLIACPPDEYSRWVPYFYREPVGDLFPSIYYRLPRLGTVNVSDPARFAWYLVYRPNASFRDESAVLYNSELFALSRQQTVLIVTGDGWYSEDPSSKGHWMSQRAVLLVIAPQPDTVTLQAMVSLAPDRRPKHLRYILDGVPAGGDFLEGATDLKTPPFKLAYGYHQLVLETDELAQPTSVDSRPLNLRFGHLHIAQPLRQSLDAERPSDAALILGMTPDRWITNVGARVILANAGWSEVTVEISGEALSAGIPGSIVVRSDAGVSTALSVSDRGKFVRVVKVKVDPAAESFRLTLMPVKTATPASLGANNDQRELGFRVKSIRVVEPPGH